MGAVDYLRQKQIHTFFRGWARGRVDRLVDSARGKRPEVDGPRHLIFAFCDHWEPLWGNADDEHGTRRVDAWAEGYPKLAERYVDADGHHPRHSFFFPGEQYRPAWMDSLGRLAKQGLGEVEFHLHHEDDTAESLRADLERYIGEIGSHGHFSRDVDGKSRYAFIHGNWCLANARSDGRLCGVDSEIPILFDTGCYADFTFPSAPDETQPNIVNQIYWPTGDLSSKRAYERGDRAKVGEVRRDRMLMIEGPLDLVPRLAKVPFRIENGNITADDPGTAARARTWVEQNIHVDGCPEWVFVKIHTHGAPDKQAASLLGDGGRSMHDALTLRYNDGDKYVLHYVTAREMYNIAIAAMDGHRGNPNEYRDHVLPPPPIVRA